MHKVKIYGPQFSNFIRSVQLVCEEKSIDYGIGFDLGDGDVEFKGEQHGLWHPYKKVPIMVCDDVVLCETSIICRYLDNTFSGIQLQPECPVKRAEVDQWCQIISLYIDKAIVRDYLLEIVFPKGEDGKPRQDVLVENTAQLEYALVVVSNQLADNEYLVGGNYSLADMLLVPILYYVREILKEDNLIPIGSPLALYLSRIEERPASKSVLIPKS